MTSATPAAITIGKGIPATDPVPMRSSVGSLTISVPLLALVSVTPCTAVKVARVAMKAGIRSTPTSSPLTRPSARPKHSATSNPCVRFPSMPIEPTMATATIATPKPAERSMPPVSSTTIAPSARIAIGDAWMTTSFRLERWTTRGSTTATTARMMRSSTSGADARIRRSTDMRVSRPLMRPPPLARTRRS